MNLTTAPFVVLDLLQFMIDESVHLRTLGLVQLHMGQTAVDMVAQMVD